LLAGLELDRGDLVRDARQDSAARLAHDLPTLAEMAGRAPRRRRRKAPEAQTTVATGRNWSCRISGA
jgi:hypothetical protein